MGVDIGTKWTCESMLGTSFGWCHWLGIPPRNCGFVRKSNRPLRTKQSDHCGIPRCLVVSLVTTSIWERCNVHLRLSEWKKWREHHTCHCGIFFMSVNHHCFVTTGYGRNLDVSVKSSPEMPTSFCGPSLGWNPDQIFDCGKMRKMHNFRQSFWTVSTK
jgi:hypothetical protein